MGINIITYTGKVRTAKHDAMVYDAALDRSGIFNGCAVTGNGETLHVALGYGIIKGRVFEITADNFTVTLPGSGTRYGALVVTLDLTTSDQPISMAVMTSNTKEFTLTKDESVNFSGGRYQMIIGTFDITTTGIQNVVKSAHILPHDQIGSKNFNDYTEPGTYYFFSDLDKYTNVPGSGVVNGWLVVFDKRQDRTTSGACKQIFFRHGSSSNHYQTWVRTQTGGVWNAWNKVVMDSDLNTIDKNVYFGSTTRASSMISVNNKHRHIGLHVSDASNAGIYDNDAPGSWIIYSDKDGNVRIPHKLIVSSFEPTNIVAGLSTGTTSYHVTVRNKYRHVGLNVSDAENGGIFDFGNDRWIIINSKNDVTTIHGSKVQLDGPIKSPKSIVRGTITITPTKAGTATYKDVTWSEMGGVPSVILTASTSIPETVSLGHSDVSKTGCRIYGTRTGGTGAFAVNYVAIYTA